MSFIITAYIWHMTVQTACMDDDESQLRSTLRQNPLTDIHRNLWTLVTQSFIEIHLVSLCMLLRIKVNRLVFFVGEECYSNFLQPRSVDRFLCKI